MAEYIKKDAIIDIFNAKADMSIGTPKAIFFAAAKMIDKFPAADVAEVRHGKWIRMEDDVVYWYACSECKKRIPKTEYGNDAWSNYCPNCGAKMDLGDDEE